MRGFLLAAVWSLALAGAAQGAPAQQGMPRMIFSNLCSEAESGDAAGYQIVIEGPSSRPSVSFDWSEGGLMEARASNVSYDDHAGAIRFKAAADGRAVAFSGSISGSRLAGTLTWIDNPGDEPRREPVRLKRVGRRDALPQCQAVARGVRPD